MLRNRPTQKEVVVETHEIVDHAEIQRLTAILNQRDQLILELRNRPLEIQERIVEVPVERIVDRVVEKIVEVPGPT